MQAVCGTVAYSEPSIQMATVSRQTSILKMWKSEEVKKKFVRRYRTVSPSGLTSVSVSVRSTTLKHSSV